MSLPPDAMSTLQTLQAWSEQGALRRLDSAMAQFVAHHDAQASPVLLVASAVLAHMEGRGHVCVPLRELVRQPQSVLAWPDPMQTALSTLWAQLPKDLTHWLHALTSSCVVRSVLSAEDLLSPDQGQPLVLGGTPDKPLLYLRRHWVYEQQVAHAVAERAKPLPDVDTAAARFWLDRLFPAPSSLAEVSPTPANASAGPSWQKIACALALRSRLTVITGGPGTGKTYTAARLLALLLATSPNPAQLRVALAAPTGKAAARLRQSIDQSLASLQVSLGAGMDLKLLTDRMGKASTVHALLGMQAGSRQFKHHAQQPLDLDVLVVDETSMVHLEMMAALMQAMPAHAKLVLLGDKDQLASVEVGSVLGDLCFQAQDNLYNADTCDYLQATCGEALQPSPRDSSPLDQQTVMLRHSHRFGSAIGELAKAVNMGVATRAAPQDLFDLPAPLGAYELLARGKPQADAARASEDPDVGKVVGMTGPLKPEEVVQLALHGRAHAPTCYADYLRIMQSGPQAILRRDQGQEEDQAQDPVVAAHAQWVVQVLQAFERFRILCAVHDGDWGERNLNLQVQRAFAAAGLLKPEGEWFAGRPVMVTRNDKALGVFNGDVGVVLPGATSTALRVWFLEGAALRSVSVSRLAHVETAFAMTIHKSQGSEFAHAVVVLPDSGGDMLTRELVYTGITRAKE
ncbi:MAG: hypothetical protein RLZZ95_985, partial [Pseudomonadota bacterium]